MTVSMASVRSAGGAAGYFGKDNYYAGGEAEAFSEWAGAGATEAGLAGKVEKDGFEAVLGGKLPDGRQVGSGARAFGTDLTFSMPKSASLLALVSGDKRLLEANRDAVRATMKWVETNLAETRIRQDGKVSPVRTGNLVYALFEHDTSRALDPQAHIHAIIANLTRLPEHLRQGARDHGWRAWHNGAVWQANTVIGSIYHAHLRDRIEALGYKTELAGKHGAFEIAGMAASAIAGFSKRRQTIEAKAAELGITSREGLLAVTLRTRDPKLDAPSRNELVDGWRKEAMSLGYNGDEVHRQALSRSAAPTSAPRGAGPVLAAIREARARIGAFLAGPTDPLVDRGLTRLARSPGAVNTQYATASAINILAEREAAFRKDAVVKTALDLGLAGVTAARVEARLAELVKSGALVPEVSNRLDGASDLVTTRDAIAQERRIVAALAAGNGQGRPLMPADIAARRLQDLAGEHPLNPGQLEAAIAIVSSPDRIVLVQGRAGAGKSTLLQSVAKAEALDVAGRLLAAEGKQALVLTGDTRGNATGLAFQNKMVADLRADAGIEAMTVHRFLHRHDRLLAPSARGTLAFNAARAALQGRYLILDEASMISNAQMDRLTAIANAMDVGRLAVIGDRKQIAPIEAGKAFTLMQAASGVAGRPVSRVETNLRQRTPAMRAVADLADAGKVRAAITAMGERVSESPDRIADAASAWLALSREERSGTTLLTSGREGRARANALIQDGLRADGTLKGPALTLEVRERVNLTREEMRYARLWEGAQFLEVTGKANALGLPSGEYRIAKVYRNGKIGLVDGAGRSHRIEPAKIQPGARQGSLALSTAKTIAVHAGEMLRWTGNDMKRGIANATITHVTAIGERGVTVRLANGEDRLLGPGDPMLKRVDLAYAINTHMAQGITSTAVFTVMGSGERNLSNVRNFLVNHTRQRDDMRLFTDDKEKLIRQIERNPGDKTSALEVIGELAVEARLSGSGGSRQLGGHAADRFGMPESSMDQSASADRFGRGTDDTVARPQMPPSRPAPELRPQPQLDRSKGMEL